VHDSITPLNTLRLGTLHEQSVEVSGQAKDVVHIVLVVDPDELAAIVHGVELQARTRAGDDLGDTRSEDVRVVDDADLVGRSAIGGIDNRLVARGRSGIRVERNANELAVHEVVARSLTVNDVNETAVGEGSAEWFDQFVNLRGEAEVLTDVSVLLLEVVRCFRGADERVLRLTVNHRVVAFGGIAGQIEIELVKHTLVESEGRSNGWESLIRTADRHRKRVVDVGDNLVAAETNEFVAVTVAPKPLAVLFENLDFASELLFSLPRGAEIVHAEAGATDSGLLEVVALESAGKLNSLGSRVAGVACSVVGSDIFPSSRGHIAHSRTLLDEGLNGLTHSGRESVLLDEAVPHVGSDKFRGDHFSDTASFLLELLIHISEIVLRHFSIFLNYC